MLPQNADISASSFHRLYHLPKRIVDMMANNGVLRTRLSSRLAKGVVKSVKKTIAAQETKSSTTRFNETMVQNCGDYVHFQTAERNILPEMVKIVKKKTDMHDATEYCLYSLLGMKHSVDVVDDIPNITWLTRTITGLREKDIRTTTYEKQN